MNGVIKVEEGVYRVTVAEAVYISPDKTLADAIKDGTLGSTVIIQDPDGNYVTKGDQGEKGDKGDVGPQGLPGSQIYSGSSEPTEDIGNEGDYYLMTGSDIDVDAGGNLYKRTLTSWELLGSVIPKGYAKVSYVDKQLKILSDRIEELSKKL